MSAVLTLLKIIGILLLILLGILLLLLIIIIFCPIFYKIAGAKDTISGTDTPNEFSLKISARWLLGLLGITYMYPQPGALKIRLFGFTLYDSNKPKKENSTVSQLSEVPSPKDEKPSEIVSKPTATEQKVSDNNTNTDSTPKDTLRDDKSKSSPKSLWDKLKHYYQEFCFYKDFWNARATQEILAKGLNRLKKILRSVFPRKIEAELLIGTGEPDTTGYVMALYGIFLSHLGRKVNITPDFEEKIFKGHFKARGHICVFTVLRHTLSVLLDRNLRIVYRRFKKHKAKVAKETAANTAGTDATVNSRK